VYYKWYKECLEEGKNGLNREVIRDDTTEEVRELMQQNDVLKKDVAELVLKVQPYKKSLGM
jgi:hypothetical protein